MATDSTELTFVRCPSCRSLVPAVSTRCRMCGAGLDASGESDDADKDQKKSGRVRQRTMSQAQSELNAAVSKLRAAEAVGSSAAESTPPSAVVPPAANSAAAEVSAAPIESEEDPLSAYIEEVDETEQNKAPQKPTLSSGAIAPTSSNGEQNGHAAAAPAAEVVVPAAHIISQPPAPVEKVATPPPTAPEPRAEEHEDTQQRVIVESGLRRHGKPSGLSFGRKDEPRAKEESSHQEPTPAQKQATPAQENRDRQPQRTERSEPVERAEAINFRRDEKRQPQPQQQQQQQQRQREEQRPREERREPERTERVERQAAPTSPRPSDGPRKTESATGRLFGWLVNYGNPDGLATELREGKFFVTASSLKTTDLIIEEPSISTPHALVTVSVDSGLQVQDLMSDRGVFVRRRGDDTYRREPDTVRVDHGDWLRFGDVEYLVSLIAHVGVK